jgi:uncharacterized protein YdaU (DUF1376 family)
VTLCNENCTGKTVEIAGEQVQRTRPYRVRDFRQSDVVKEGKAMSSRPWMPFYVNDFRMDTLDLKPDEIGVYMIILMIAWRRDDAAIPNDMPRLKRSLQSCIAGFHGHTFNRIVPAVLGRYFELGEDGKWRNPRLSLERQKLSKLSAKQKQNADKRWSDVRENKRIANAIGNAKAMPSHSHKITSFLLSAARESPPVEKKRSTDEEPDEGSAVEPSDLLTRPVWEGKRPSDLTRAELAAYYEQRRKANGSKPAV